MGNSFRFVSAFVAASALLLSVSSSARSATDAAEASDASDTASSCQAPPVIHAKVTISNETTCLRKPVAVLRGEPCPHEWVIKSKPLCRVTANAPIFFEPGACQKRERFGSRQSNYLALYGHRDCSFSTVKSPGTYSETYDIEGGPNDGSATAKLTYSYTVPSKAEARRWRREHCNCPGGTGSGSSGGTTEGGSDAGSAGGSGRSGSGLDASGGGGSTTASEDAVSVSWTNSGQSRGSSGGCSVPPTEVPPLRAFFLLLACSLLAPKLRCSSTIPSLFD